MARVIGLAAHYEMPAVLAILLVGVLVFAIRRWRHVRARTMRSEGP